MNLSGSGFCPHACTGRVVRAVARDTPRRWAGTLRRGRLTPPPPSRTRAQHTAATAAARRAGPAPATARASTARAGCWRRRPGAPHLRRAPGTGDCSKPRVTGAVGRHPSRCFNEGCQMVHQSSVASLAAPTAGTQEPCTGGCEIGFTTGCAHAPPRGKGKRAAADAVHKDDIKLRRPCRARSAHAVSWWPPPAAHHLPWPCPVHAAHSDHHRLPSRRGWV